MSALLYSDGGRIGRLDGMLNKAVAMGDTTQSDVKNVLDSLDKKHTLSLNTKVLYTLYVKALSTHFKGYSTSEASDLHAIAKQCPEQGGPAVYQARAIIHTIDTAYVDYSIYCRLTQSKSNKNIDDNNRNIIQSVLPIFYIAPNPAYETINLIYASNEDENIIIINMTGQIMANYIIPKGQGVFPINVSKYAQGIYIVKGYTLTKTFNFGKVIEVLK